MKTKASFIVVLFLLIGSCTDPGVDSECNQGKVSIEFNTVVDGQELVLHESLYQDYLQRNYRIELLKFYLSNMMLEKHNGELVSIEEVRLIDYSNDDVNTFCATIDTGRYVNLHFGIGLNEEMNASDPAEFESSNPLSIAQNTYWTWASKYKFFMMEGRVDTMGSANPNSIFSYHTGFDTLYREISLSLEDFYIHQEDNSFELQLDLNQVVNGDVGVIDFVSESFSHSTDNFEIVETISNNLVSSFTINP